MSQVAPFYCLQQLTYHTHDDCPQAQSIPLAYKREGTGGKVACLCCRRLSKLVAKREPLNVFNSQRNVKKTLSFAKKTAIWVG